MLPRHAACIWVLACLCLLNCTHTLSPEYIDIKLCIIGYASPLQTNEMLAVSMTDVQRALAMPVHSLTRSAAGIMTDSTHELPLLSRAEYTKHGFFISIMAMVRMTGHRVQEAHTMLRTAAPL